MSIALIASFYLKNLVSRKVWRAFHFVTYLAFVLAMVHGVMAGTDTSNPVVRWMYILTGASLLFVTLYRILMVRGESAGKPAPAGAHTTPVARRTQPVLADAPNEIQAERVV